MIFWIVILFLLAGIILVIHPSHGDYQWFQALRRPLWLSFHVWTPILQLISYSGVLISLVLVKSAPDARPWSLAFAHLLLIALNQISLCFTCQSRRLKAGSLVGAAVTTTALALCLSVYRLSPLAGLALTPFVLIALLESVAQWQMVAFNSGSEPNRRTWSMRPQLTSMPPIGTSRRRGR